MQIDLQTLPERDAHDWLTSALIPRPIAWVSTVNGEGQANLAPFSFISGVTWRPATLVFSVANRPDGSRKDTVRNIEATGQFVVNMVSLDLVSRMVQTAAVFPYGENEAFMAKVPLVPSVQVAPPRVAESKVAFECSLDRLITVGQGACAGNLILGRVLLMHVEDGIVENGRTVDPVRFEAVGRLSGTRFCTLGPVFEIEAGNNEKQR